jgi:hypothetical protein
MGNIGGQASGDFRLGQGALRILYSLIKDTIPSLAGDAFLQSNPSAVTVVAARSTTLSATVKKGVLGGSVAFTRPDVGQNIVGGAFLVGGTVYTPRTRPLGLFINDAGGNSYENTPAVASGKGPFLRGGSVGVKIYETQVQTVLPLVPGGAAGVIGDPLTYNVGDKLTVFSPIVGQTRLKHNGSPLRQWAASRLVPLKNPTLPVWAPSSLLRKFRVVPKCSSPLRSSANPS